MKGINNRQYKLSQIKPSNVFKNIKAKLNIKRGKRYDGKLDRRSAN
ncbi:MAG: hypothetical protein NC822_03450 [Candidatus Omnitrophica bacterium]|nr:hypothetical protein [Candidatus Omnitrophota bacterium]MCM8827115.1 hypothetical protein [Candidatus Omnitrophota bacterium]